MKRFTKLFSLKNAAKLLMAASIGICTLQNANAQSAWVTGDFHQHTTFSDGSYSFFYMAQKNAEYGLDWWANSEHGGAFNRNGALSGYDLFSGKDSVGNLASKTLYWDSYPTNPVIGDKNLSDNKINMWRWQSIRDLSYNLTRMVRSLYPNKIVFQSFEWNVPGHEHCSMGLFVDQFKLSSDNGNAIAEFEYKFDNNDKDSTGGLSQGWAKSKATGHAKALEALAWLQTNYKTTSWTVFAHPERKPQKSGGYQISDFRDFNDAAPDVAIGFESVPGHQMGAERGGYGKTAVGGGTYGGSGYFSVKVGGLWDAMLSEGRHFWLFSNSDCHDTTTATGSDFFPGEYQVNHIFTNDAKNPQAIVDGMKSGNVWVGNGNLIDTLVFKVNSSTMGETASINESSANVTIKIHVPNTPNHNVWSSYNKPQVDHIDLIAGKLGEKFPKTDSLLYHIDTVATTSVIARFDANGAIKDGKNIVSQKWIDNGNGWKEMTMQVNLPSNMYFRLRGTNLGLNVANETDANGNPLADSLNGGLSTNNRVKAFADLWFYSNPIFVKTTKYSGIIESGKIDNGDFKISPNPVTNILDINAVINAEVIVNNSIGEILIQTTVNAGQNQIDFSKFAKGAYYVTFKSNGAAQTQKIVKD